MPRKCFPGSNDSMQKTKQKNCKAWTAITQVVNVVSLETKTAAKVKKKKKSGPEEKEGRRHWICQLKSRNSPQFLDKHALVGNVTTSIQRAYFLWPFHVFGCMHTD